jgi:ParB family chromosome partitioning protein
MTVHSERQSGLGRGLAALIPQRNARSRPDRGPARAHPAEPAPAAATDGRGELESLAASIADHGVLLPILVTQTLDGYQIVAGERRFRLRSSPGSSASRSSSARSRIATSSSLPSSRTSSART